MGLELGGGVEGDPGYIKFCNKGQIVWMSKDYCKLQKTIYSKLRNLVFFSIWGKMQESGLTEVIPSRCPSAIWGQHPVFSHPELPWGSPTGVAAA